MFACMKAKLSQKCAWYYTTGPLHFSARSLTVMFPFKISILHRKMSPERPHGCTTHVEHRWSKLELFSATCIIAPTQSKVVHGHICTVHITWSPYQNPTKWTTWSIRSVDPFHTHPRCSFATKKETSQMELARSLDSVFGSSLSLTLPHSYSSPMLSPKVHAWYQKPARTINKSGHCL